MRIIIFGASGFLAVRLIGKLLQSYSPDKIVGVSRNASFNPRAAQLGVQLLDFDARDCCDSLISEGDIVINCILGDFSVITETSESIYSSCLKKGAGKYIYLSSCEVYGDTAGDALDENSEIGESNFWYSRAKRISEEIIYNNPDKSIPVVILRPTIIYGPFSKPWVDRYYSRIVENSLPYFDLTGTANLIHVDDVASYIIWFINDPFQGIQVFNVNSMDRITWNDYFNRFYKFIDINLESSVENRSRYKDTLINLIKPTVKKIFVRNKTLILTVSNRIPLLKRLLKYFKGSIESTYDSHEINLFRDCRYYSSDKLINYTKMSPSMDFNSGMNTVERYINWYLK